MTDKDNKNAFTLFHVDVRPHVSKKGKAAYLSWPYVVSELKSQDPDSSYSVKQYPEIDLQTGKQTGRKVNYCEGVNGEGAYVTVTATFKGQSHTESLPCYKPVPMTKEDANGNKHFVTKTDFKGKPYTPHIMSAVKVPNATIINKSIKRCYVKAVAVLTGLGLELYIDPVKYMKGSKSAQKKHQYWNQSNHQHSIRPRANHPATQKQINALSSMSKDWSRLDGIPVSKTDNWLKMTYGFGTNKMTSRQASYAITNVQNYIASAREKQEKVGA